MIGLDPYIIKKCILLETKTVYCLLYSSYNIVYNKRNMTFSSNYAALNGTFIAIDAYP